LKDARTMVAGTLYRRLAGAAVLLGLVAGELYYHDRYHDRPAAFITHASITNALPQSDASALLREADRLSWLLNWAASEPLYERAEAEFRRSGDTRNELYARIGRLRAQFDQLSFVTISNSFNQILQDPITHHDPQLKLWCLVNKGYADLEIDLPSAKADWITARNIAVQIGDDRWAVRSSGELGVIAFLEGNTSVAAAAVGQALFSTMASGDIGGEIRLSDMLGTGLNEIHRYSEALPFFNRVIKLAGQHKDVGFPFMAYERKAEALMELGRDQEAQAVVQQVLDQAEIEKRSGPKMQALVLMGRMQFQKGDHAAALQSLETAARIATSLNFYRMVACAMYDVAHIYDSMGELKKADISMAAAIDASRRVGDRFFVPRDLTALAVIKVREGETHSADLLFEEAEDVVDGMLVNMHVPFWKSGLITATKQTYTNHFRLLAATHNVDKALRVLERVRARTATAMLQAHRPALNDFSAGTTDIEDQISNLQVSLMRERHKPEREELLEHLLDDERRLILVQNNSALSRREFPGKPAALRAVQQVLNKDELLLEYVLDEPHSFCISISRTHASIVSLSAGRREIEGLVNEYLSQIRKQKPGREIAQRLHAVLLSPIAIQSKQTLIIAADGALRRIPFEALRNPAGEYLIKSHVIIYTPGATVLQTIRTSMPAHHASLPLLAIGDVPYEELLNSQERQDLVKTKVLRGLYDLMGIRLSSLPQTREEVISIGKMTGRRSVLLLGPEATEYNFKAQPLSDFKVIHMAVHSLSETEIPERAALVLARDPRSQDDGLLQVREILELRVNADLVTLSACNTGIEEATGIGLEEAFLIAGARTVVASLWAVEDTYTTELMRHFYANLVAGKPKAVALRQAKLDMLEKYGDTTPFYWASFVLAGDGASPITFGDLSLHN
jgi:CHAT domain-containing protein